MTLDKKEIVEKWKKSGKTQSEFAKENDININTLRAYVYATSKEIANEKETKIEPKETKYEKPFFIREKGPYIRNVKLTEDLIRPCVINTKHYITDDMDIETLKLMQSIGIIKLYGI